MYNIAMSEYTESSQWLEQAEKEKEEFKKKAPISKVPLVRDALNEKAIGYGQEKIVVDHPMSPDKVVSVYKSSETMTGEEARIRYHLQKLLRLLLPDNVPDIYDVYSKPATLVTEKITPPVGFKKLEAKVLGGKRLSAFLKYLDGLGIYYDFEGVNFKTGPKGTPYFVDNFVIRDIYNIDSNLRSTIDENLEGEQREEALMHLDRLIPLLDSFYNKRLS